MADAFAHTYWWALGLLALALLAALLLPRTKPEPIDDEDEAAAGAPVLMHA
jgi:hypothetical protein